MQDLFLVDIVQSLTDLTDNRAGFWILKAVAFPHLLQKLPISAELDQQINVILILEVAIKRRNVPMIEVKLYAELPCDLVHILLLPDLLLGHDFHGAKEASLLVNHHHHLPELPFAHLLADYEVAFANFLYCFLGFEGD